MTQTRTAAQLEELLYRHDPIGLATLGLPPDEYRPEAETIAPRLHAATSAADVQGIIHEEFVAWFTAGVAGDAGEYAAVAEEVWSPHSGAPTWD